MTDEESATAVRRDRFSGGPARGFLSSLAADRRIFAADIAVDRAHVVMLVEQDIVDGEAASAILGALAEIEAAGHGALPEGEDIHEAIETAVIEGVERDGETVVTGVGPEGGRMHTARSRNDEVATCIRHRLRADLLALAETTNVLREALLEAADSHTDTVMPGYTHLQPAQPTTVAHWLLSYESALARDVERLLDCYGRVNRSPLGAGAFAGVSFPVDRERTADLLGFDGVVENSADAAAGRDFLVETAGALCALAATLSGIAEDGILFANRGYLDLSDAYASTSSIMPQKKNPDTLELVRASAGDALAGLSGVFATLKGLPRAYNRDLQRGGPHVWDAIDAVTEATEVTAGAVATATWDAQALAADAGEGFSTATGVADLLARSGIPFRTAHEVVAAAAEQGDDYEALDAAARELLGDPLGSVVDRAVVERALDPAESVAMRDSLGGPAPEVAAGAIERAEEALAGDQETLDAEREALAAADAALDEEVSAWV
ncbi:MAG: argininosuccinate lyase [Halobacteriales archaeon]